MYTYFNKEISEGDAIVHIHANGNIIYANNNFKENFKADYLTDNHSWIEVDRGIDDLAFMKLRHVLIEEGELIWATTLEINKKLYPVQIEGFPISSSHIEQVCFVVRPKTEDYKDLSYILDLNKNNVAWSWNFTTGEFIISKIVFEILGVEQTNLNEKGNIYHIVSPLLTNDESQHLKDLVKLARQQKRAEVFKWQSKKSNYRLYIVPVLNEETTKTLGIKGVISKEMNTVDKERMLHISETVYNQTRNALFILDTRLAILFSNPAAHLMLGYEKGEILHKLTITKIDIENSQESWNNIISQVENDKIIQIVTSFQKKSAKIVPVKLTLYYYSDRRGDLILIEAEDITKERLSQSHLNASLAQKEILTRKLELEKQYLISEKTENYQLDNIISQSEGYAKIIEQIHQVAPTETTVLIQGETGTGKELIARAIHQLSNPSNRAMITINCANLPRDLIESELFGHEKGAFTGAESRKIGRFELAHNSTIFLDEIGELPVNLQSRLLRVLQEGEIERIGGLKSINIDVRIIAATNRDLQKMVEKKEFREDLYYRLNVFPIFNIPLRERKEDIELLTYHFLAKFSQKSKKNIQFIRKEDMKKLRKYSFPGNVRELENIIERSVILTKGDTLNLDFWSPMNKENIRTDHDFSTLEELQREHIIRALEKTKWRISGDKGAARLLGIKDQTLFSKMRKLGISRT